jgi:hypothetical protein
VVPLTAWADAMELRDGRRHPESSVTDRELGDDVVTIADLVSHARAERRLVELNGACCLFAP